MHFHFGDFALAISLWQFADEALKSEDNPDPRRQTQDQKHDEHALRRRTKKYCCVFAVVPVSLPRFYFYLLLFAIICLGGSGLVL